MRTILLICALFFAINSHAQDYKLIEEIQRAPSLSKASEIAEKFAKCAASPYRLFSTKESFNAGILRFRFIPSSLTDDDMQQGKFTEQQRLSFITIDFSFYNAGEDINAKRPETITYKLNEITGSYPEIFAIWKKFFRPDTDAELTKTDYKSQRLKDTDRKIDLYIFATETGWALRNLSLN